MTYEEYSKIRHKVPYTFSVKSGENFLYYFGERHSFDPSDKQWIEVEEYFEDFLNKTKNRKRIVFVEGGVCPIEDSKEISIIKHGGMGCITYLAKQQNIDTYSPEPSGKYERGELEKIFSRKEIQYYYFARMSYQWSCMGEIKPSFEKYINHSLLNDKRESGWVDFDFSLESMKKIHFDIFNGVFDEDKKDFLYNIINPVEPKTVINKVAEMSSTIRDNYIVNEIKKYISNGYSIFAQYGYSHVVMQEPLLRGVL